MFCDDAVNVKAALKEPSRDRVEGQQAIPTDAMCGDCKFDAQAAINNRLCPPGRNTTKRPPRRQRSGGRFVRAAPRAVMSLNGQFQSMRVSNDHPKNSPSEALRAQATPPESPQF
ncbi:hypothetical protein TELCIR_24095 [Teladorsagia circumcincta]|uniref:Uncharacterized protein n=1 Tax=Teladorsagia circumcincta TaxID=45464 RepID=A0A2G9T990_TELCI|nr:hypothetical protein TELCIR_24095 [Teladorsagia circumcincta]